MEPGRKRRGHRQESNETAASKRRAQVRLAQRAYRARQEATLSSCRERVRQLEDLVERLSGSFLSFSGRVMQSDALNADPKLARSLRQTTEQLVLLATQADDPEDDADAVRDENPPTMSEGDFAAPISQPSEMPTCQNGSNSLGPEDVPFEVLQPYCTFPDNMIHTSHRTRVPGARPSSPRPSLPNRHTPTFAEKLHVFCGERAYRLLNDPRIPDWRLSRAFGALLDTIGRDRAVTYLATRLEYAHTPEAIDSSQCPLPRHAGLELAGSLPSFRAGLSAPELPGECEEVWLGPLEVERYLKENNIVLDTQKPEPAIPRSAPCMGVDVAPVSESSLILWLSEYATCLGRMVGFRRRDLQEVLLGLAPFSG